MTIIPPIPLTPDEHDKILDELLDPRTPTSGAHVEGACSIEETADRYVMSGLPMPFNPGKTCTLELSKDLLDNGATHTQDQWLNQEWSRKADRVEWVLPSAPEYASIILGLHASKDDPAVRHHVEAIRTLLSDDFADRYMLTSTRIIFRAPRILSRVLANLGMLESVTEEVIHQYRRIEELTQRTAPHMKSGFLSVGMEDALYAFMGFKDIGAFETATEWLVGTRPFICGYGLDNPLKSTWDVSGVLLLGMTSKTLFFIDTYASVKSARLARGVVARDRYGPEMVTIYV